MSHVDATAMSDKKQCCNYQRSEFIQISRLSTLAFLRYSTRTPFAFAPKMSTVYISAKPIAPEDCSLMVAYAWKWSTIVVMILYCLKPQEYSSQTAIDFRSMPIGIFATALVVAKLFWARIGRTLAFFCMTVCSCCWIPLRRPTLFACTRIATIMLHSLGLVSIALVYYDVHSKNGALLVSPVVSGAIIVLPIFWGIPMSFFLFHYFFQSSDGFSVCIKSPDPLFCGLYHQPNFGLNLYSCIFDEMFCQNGICCCMYADRFADDDIKLGWFEDPESSSTFFDALMISESDAPLTT